MLDTPYINPLLAIYNMIPGLTPALILIKYYAMNARLCISLWEGYAKEK